METVLQSAQKNEDNIAQNLEGQSSNDIIFNIVFKEDEITWQSLIYELIKTEQMNPWDVDVSLLSERYIGTLKKLQEADLRVSGKVVLAAAILLKLKSDRFLGEDLAYFDSMMAGEDDTDLTEEMPEIKREKLTKQDLDRLRLVPRTPQPRSRKVSVYDLVDALQKALEVRKRRNILSQVQVQIKLPEKHVDITQIIHQVYDRIKPHFESGNKISFSHLIGDNASKEDKVYTYIPLLHLSNQRKVDLEQQEHFGEIDILQAKPDAV